MNDAGAIYVDSSHCRFTVWAPLAKKATLHLTEPTERQVTLTKSRQGYFVAELENIAPGTRYFYRLGNGPDLPDPASHAQPLGVHGPSEVVAHHEYPWHDQAWRGLPLSELIFYELHVGTFTPQGTFEAIISRLDDLADTGVNAIELMPVAQFPGNRNWGYDGVYPYAPQNTYGGPAGLKKLVDACHQKGIAVFLDVVYNHLGPEGNYLAAYGPYFTKTYSIPWGQAINFDGEWADGVRDYILGNIAHWHDRYHIDGLRVDAVHMMYDNSAIHILEAANRVKEKIKQQSGRSFYLIAESDLNSPRIIKHPDGGGYGFDAQWLDDFHHAAYVLLDKQGKARYEDFGDPAQWAKAITDGFVFSGEYVKFRKRKFGSTSAGIPGDRFVAFNQNHDQVGNRVGGERLSVLVDFDRLRLAAAMTFLSPYIPMIFMGEEYAEEAPFFFFVNHSDPGLIRAVREGRKKEFAGFKTDAEPRDPQDEHTFTDCKLNWEARHNGKHAMMLAWHKKLITLRKTIPALQNFIKSNLQAHVIGQTGIALFRQPADAGEPLLCLFNLSGQDLAYTMPCTYPVWEKILDSSAYSITPSPHAMPMRAEAGETISLLPLSVSVYNALSKIPGRPPGTRV